jgi:transcriptional regulator with XRE-family HTH domain
MTRLATADFNDILGQRLAATRAALGLTQAQFAHSMGVAARTYENYERGTRELPAAVMRNLLEIHGLDPRWLLTGPGVTPVWATSSGVNRVLMQQVIRVVAKELTAANVQFTPTKYAQFIELCYDLACETGSVKASRFRDLIGLVA